MANLVFRSKEFPHTTVSMPIPEGVMMTRAGIIEMAKSVVRAGLKTRGYKHAQTISRYLDRMEIFIEE